jgi:hypothetical protein
LLLFGGVLVAQPAAHDLKKHTRFFKAYMRETFPDFVIRDGEYLFILPTGCRNCVEQATDYLSAHLDLITDKYQAMLVSASTLKRLPSNIREKVPNLLCDATNKLDRMSFGIDGVSVLKIKNGRIVACKSMTVEDLKNPADFFVPIP